jgi:hypothetical protein
LRFEDYEMKVVFSYHPLGVAGALSHAGHTFPQSKAKIPMARTLDEIVRLDRRWFRAHPERRHRCRLPDTGEFDLYDRGRGTRLVMAIHHLGRGRVVYQPVIFRGTLPRDERSAAALFALAVRHPGANPYRR